MRGALRDARYVRRLNDASLERKAEQTRRAKERRDSADDGLSPEAAAEYKAHVNAKRRKQMAQKRREQRARQALI